MNEQLSQRILCLHGSRQTGSVFQERISRLEDALPQTQATLFYVDGPHSLPLSDGDDLPMRTWYKKKDGEYCACASLRLFDELWKRFGPFDGIVGFSAGALAACLIASLPERFQGLVWIMISGCPNLDNMSWCSCSSMGSGRLSIPQTLQSMHIFGKLDTLVPPQDSAITAREYFHAPVLVEHDHGHSLATQATRIDQYLTFIHQSSKANDELEVIRQEESESLFAIYPDEVRLISSTDIGLLGGVSLIVVRISLDGTRFTGLFELIFRLGATYPNSPPSVSIKHTMGMLEFSSSIESALLKTIQSSMDPLIGSPMIFDAISTATQFLQDYQDPDPSAPSPSDSDSADDDSFGEEDLEETLGIISTRSAIKPLTDLKSKNARGKWTHTIGLVGKPSAGKSTFFNAATRSLNARMGFHPFTTIDPNVAQGNWRAPQKHVPAQWVQEDKEVLIPCIIKDVAGVVPGAWEGRGRGNKFLNDLCDADVLIHVIDASGLSDSDGNILPLDTPTPQDPLHDIHWVRHELFQWILTNITKKWDSIVKRPNRLPMMFSGYRAPRWLVNKVLDAAGFDTTVSPPFAKQFWSLAKLEGAVNAFLDARFPMLLGMNKADLGPAAGHISRVKELFGDHMVIPVCAASEIWLQAQENAGTITYKRSVYGSKTTVSQNQPFELESQQFEWARVQNVVEKFNGTGVDAALSAAIMLRPPVFCFPVSDFETLTSLLLNGKSSSCLPLKPGSTVFDCFELLAHGPEAVLSGQFVRAEAVGLDGNVKPRPVKKEAEIDDACAVIKLMSNRKSRWQTSERK
ncbi:UNVERIFIED_CONTAM: hypothetical protein HDU68_002666 [Siphonaria sp. JEL0065]|nr:hypothetical protein HDU68_002666 [Siphonaria sp. JEL0065]